MNFPSPSRRMDPPFHVENEKKKGGMRMDGDDSIERGSKPFRYESW